ncbi:hypothetical protein AMS68_005701 [Peltaster fructicola]|uniref:Alpha/beta hydrolase fold-3 domain-containing protein n=1 Tax=Peltaster fructicola TaxID=286661 RepID=A0A6H0XZK8_9PEZI|nr:hypothetical protein AMS68_005701 [Peltaster fructicola]
MINLEALPWILLQNLVNGITYAKRSRWITSVDQPDEIKVYPGREHLFGSRIFRPASTNNALPLVIRIHGGGFIMNSPCTDDNAARYVADNVGCNVVSVDYSKAPRNPFPAAYEDLVALSLDIIGDSSLHVNPEQVVLWGSSAGANLALAIAQDPRLRSKIAGVLANTPVVELITPFEAKMASRPDPAVPDFLQTTYSNLLKFYLAGQDISTKDVRLNPSQFAKRENLPKHMYLTSAEHDLLSRESRLMAEDLAKGAEKQQLDDGWQAGSVKWSLDRGVKHAYEAFPEKDPKAEAARLLAIEATRQNVVSWLKAVFKAT